MTRTLSTAANLSINATNTDEVWLVMVQLTGVGGTTYLVRNTEPVEHAGNVYLPYAFDISVPDEDSEGVPVLQFVADNANNDLLGEFRKVLQPVQAIVFWVLASQPEVIDIGPYELEIRGFGADEEHISGNMEVEPIMDQQFTSLIMSPTVTPGMF